MNNYEDDFIRIINKPDQYAPEVWYRQVERIEVGRWFFDLLPIYKYQFTEWYKENT
jgi:hypothetical protein